MKIVTLRIFPITNTYNNTLQIGEGGGCLYIYFYFLEVREFIIFIKKKDLLSISIVTHVATIHFTLAKLIEISKFHTQQTCFRNKM